MNDYTPATEEVVLPPLNEEVIKQLALLGLDQMVVDVDDEKAEQFLAHVDRWFAEVKAEEAKAERERLIELLEEYRSDLYEFADSSAIDGGVPAWFIGRAAEVESCIALIKGEEQ